MANQFDEVSKALAQSQSRRGFLGHLGWGALGLAVAIATLVAFPSQARAGRQCCCGGSIGGAFFCHKPHGGKCVPLTEWVCYGCC